MKTGLLVCSLLLAPSFVAALPAEKSAPKSEKKILIVPGDIHRAYEVIDSIGSVKPAKVNALGFSGPTGAFAKGLSETFKEFEEAARKLGADAVINVQVTAVFQPYVPGHDQDVGQVIALGTAVRFTDAPAATK